jgi:hypothetical protein
MLDAIAAAREPKERTSPPPKSPTKSEEKLDEELEGSFPASDPPSSTTPTSVGGPARPRVKRPAPGKPPHRGRSADSSARAALSRRASRKRKRGVSASDFEAAKEALGVVVGRANSGKDGGNALTYSLPG